MKGKILISLIILFPLLSAQTALADMALDTVCSDGVYYERLWNESSLIINNSFTCQNGCANNGLECDSPAQPESFFAFAIVISAAAFTFAFLALKLNEEYKPLQFMFLAFSVLYIAFGAYVVSGFALLTLNSLNTILVQSYIIGIMTVFATVLYFVYLLLRKLLEALMIKRERGRPFKL